MEDIYRKYWQQLTSPKVYSCYSGLNVFEYTCIVTIPFDNFIIITDYIVIPVLLDTYYVVINYLPTFSAKLITLMIFSGFFHSLYTIFTSKFSQISQVGNDMLYIYDSLNPSMSLQYALGYRCFFPSQTQVQFLETIPSYYISTYLNAECS